jgi:hypothetical protein
MSSPFIDQDKELAEFFTGVEYLRGVAVRQVSRVMNCGGTACGVDPQERRGICP